MAYEWNNIFFVSNDPILTEGDKTLLNYLKDTLPKKESEQLDKHVKDSTGKEIK